jgi:hypothetical protein
MMSGMRARKLALALLVAGAAATATAVTSAGTRPSLKVSPNQVQQGANVTFTGSGWPANVRVQLLIGRPKSEAVKFGAPRTRGTGSFRYVLPIKPDAPTGRYVILACRNSCKTKVSRPLTILPSR